MAGITLESAKLLIDYTSLEFFSLVNDQRLLVTERFPHITNYETASQVEMMIELYSSIGDRLYMMQNKQANEVILITARRRRNIINGAKSLGYPIKTAQAATGTIQATIPTAQSSDVPIATGTLILTKESDSPQTFRVTTDFVIPAGQTSATGPIKNSVVYDLYFATTFEADQRHRLPERPFLDNESLVVTVNGEEWTQVDNFLDSTGTSKHYVVEIDENDYGYLVFGDGTNGLVPQDDIEGTYEVGGGLIGNQAQDTIQDNSDDFETTLGVPVKVTFTNPAATAGGLDRETAEQIKTNAIRSLKTITRTICREDFSINVETKFTNVARSIAFARPDDATIPLYAAWMYVVPVGGGNPSSTLRDQILEYLTTIDGAPVPMGMALDIKNPLYDTTELVGTVVVDPSATLATVKANVMAALRSFFDFQSVEPNFAEYTIDFGKTIRWSRVLYEITRIYGVRYVSDFHFDALATGADKPVAQKYIPLLDDSNFDAVGGLEFEVAA